MTDALTTDEVAHRLGVSSERVRALIRTGRLPAWWASPSEMTALLETKRIKAVPAQGLRLVHEADLVLLGDRRPGRPRKAAEKDGPQPGGGE